MNRNEKDARLTDLPLPVIRVRKGSWTGAGGEAKDGRIVGPTGLHHNASLRLSEEVHDGEKGDGTSSSTHHATKSGNDKNEGSTEESSAAWRHNRVLELLRPANQVSGKDNVSIPPHLSFSVIPKPLASLTSHSSPAAAAGGGGGASAPTMIPSASPPPGTGPVADGDHLPQYQGALTLKDRLEARHQQALNTFRQLIAELNQKADDQQRERLSELHAQLEHLHRQTEDTLQKEASRVAAHREFLEHFGRTYVEATTTTHVTSSLTTAAPPAAILGASSTPTATITNSSSTSPGTASLTTVPPRGSIGANPSFTFSVVSPALVDEYHKEDEMDFTPARHRMTKERYRLLSIIVWLRTSFQMREKLITATADALEMEEAKRRESIETALRQLMEKLAKTTYCSITAAHVLSQQVIHHVNEQISTNYSATKSLQSRLLSRETLKLSAYQQRAALLYTEAKEVMALSTIWWLRSTLQSPPFRRPHSRIEATENIRKVALNAQREVRHFLDSLRVTCQTLREESPWGNKEEKESEEMGSRGGGPTTGVEAAGSPEIKRSPSVLSHDGRKIAPKSSRGGKGISGKSFPREAVSLPVAQQQEKIALPSSTAKMGVLTVDGSGGGAGEGADKGLAIPPIVDAALGGPSAHPLFQRLGGSSSAGWLRHYQKNLFSDPFPSCYTEVVDEWRMKAIVVIRNGLASIVSLADEVEKVERRRVAAAEVLLEGLSKELDWIFRPLPPLEEEVEAKPKRKKSKKKGGGAELSKETSHESEDREVSGSGSSGSRGRGPISVLQETATTVSRVTSFNGTLTPFSAGLKGQKGVAGGEKGGGRGRRQRARGRGTGKDENSVGTGVGSSYHSGRSASHSTSRSSSSNSDTSDVSGNTDTSGPSNGYSSSACTAVGGKTTISPSSTVPFHSSQPHQRRKLGKALDRRPYSTGKGEDNHLRGGGGGGGSGGDGALVEGGGEEEDGVSRVPRSLPIQGATAASSSFPSSYAVDPISGIPAPLSSLHKAYTSEEQAYCLHGSFCPDILDFPFEPLLDPDILRWTAFDQAGQQLARPALGFLTEECRWFAETVRSGLLRSHQCLDETILTSFKSVLRQFDKASGLLVTAVRETFGVARTLFQKQDDHHKDYEEKLSFLEEDFAQISFQLSHAVSKKVAMDLFQDGLDCLDRISKTYLTYHHDFLHELSFMKEEVEKNSRQMYLHFIQKLGVEQVQDTVIRLQREYTDKAGMWLGKWIQEQILGVSSSTSSAAAAAAMHKKNAGGPNSSVANPMSSINGSTTNNPNASVTNAGHTSGGTGGGKKGGGEDGNRHDSHTRHPHSSHNGHHGSGTTSSHAIGGNGGARLGSSGPHSVPPSSVYSPFAIFLSSVGHLPAPTGFGTAAFLETVQGILAASQAAAANAAAAAAAATGGGMGSSSTGVIGGAGVGGGNIAALGALTNSPTNFSLLLFCIAQMILEGTKDPFLTVCRNALPAALSQQLFQMESDLAKDIPVSYPVLHTLPCTTQITPPSLYEGISLLPGGSSSSSPPPPLSASPGPSNAIFQPTSKEVMGGGIPTGSHSTTGRDTRALLLLTSGGSVVVGGGGNVPMEKMKAGFGSPFPSLPRRHSSLSFVNIPLSNSASRSISGTLPGGDGVHGADPSLSMAGTTYSYYCPPSLLAEEEGGLSYHVVRPLAFIEDPPVLSPSTTSPTMKGGNGDHSGGFGKSGGGGKKGQRQKGGKSDRSLKGGSRRGGGGGEEEAGGPHSVEAGGVGTDRRPRYPAGTSPGSPVRGVDAVSGVASAHSVSHMQRVTSHSLWGGASVNSIRVSGSLNASSGGWGALNTTLAPLLQGPSSMAAHNTSNTSIGNRMKKGLHDLEGEEGEQQQDDDADRASALSNRHSVLTCSNSHYLAMCGSTSASGTGVGTGGSTVRLGSALVDAVASATAAVFAVLASSRPHTITVDSSFTASYQPFFEDTIANPEKCFLNPLSLHLCLDTLRYEILNWVLMLYYRTMQSTREYVERSAGDAEIRLNHLLRHHRRRPATFQAEVFEARVREVENKSLQSDKYCARLLDRMQKWESTLHLLQKDPAQEKKDTKTLNELAELEKKVVEATSKHVLHALERRCAVCREHYIEEYEAQARKVLEAAAKQREMMESDVAHYLSERERQLATEAYGEQTLEEAVAKDPLSLRVRWITDQMHSTMESMKTFSEQEVRSRREKMDQYAQSFTQLHQRSMAELQLGRHIQEVLSRVKITIQSIIQRSKSEEEKVNKIVKQVEEILLPGRGGMDEEKKKKNNNSTSLNSNNNKRESMISTPRGMSGGECGEKEPVANPMAGLETLVQRLFSSSFLERETEGEEEGGEEDLEGLGLGGGGGRRTPTKAGIKLLEEGTRTRYAGGRSGFGGRDGVDPESDERNGPSNVTSGGRRRKGRWIRGNKAERGGEDDGGEAEDQKYDQASEISMDGGGERIRRTGGDSRGFLPSHNSSFSTSSGPRLSCMQGSIPPPILPFSSSSGIPSAKEGQRGMKKFARGGNAGMDTPLPPPTSRLSSNLHSPLALALRSGLDLHHTTSGIGELPQDVEEVLLEELEESRRLVQVRYQRLLFSSPITTVLHLLDVLRPLLYLRGSSLHVLQWAVELIRLSPSHYIEPRPILHTREGGCGTAGAGEGMGSMAGGVGSGVHTAVGGGQKGNGGGYPSSAFSFGTPGSTGGTGVGGNPARRRGGRVGASGASGRSGGGASSGSGGGGGGGSGSGSGMLHFNTPIIYDALPPATVMEVAVRRALHVAKKEILELLSSHLQRYPSSLLHPSPALLKAVEEKELYTAVDTLLEIPLQRFRDYHRAATLTFHEYVQRLYVALQHAPQFLTNALLRLSVTTLQKRLECLMSTYVAFYRHSAALREYHRRLIKVALASQCHRSQLEHLDTVERVRQEKTVSITTSMWGNVVKEIQEEVGRHGARCVNTIQNFFHLLKGLISPSHLVPCEVSLVVGYHRGLHHLLRRQQREGSFRDGGGGAGGGAGVVDSSSSGGGPVGGGAVGASGHGGGGGTGTGHSSGHGAAAATAAAAAAGEGSHRLPESVPVFKPDGRPPNASQVAMENAVQVAIQYTGNTGSPFTPGSNAISATGLVDSTGSSPGSGSGSGGSSGKVGGGAPGTSGMINSVDAMLSNGGSASAGRGTSGAMGSAFPSSSSLSGQNLSSDSNTPTSPSSASAAAATAAAAAAASAAAAAALTAAAAVQAGSSSIVIPVPQYVEVECPGLPVYAFQPLHYFSSRHPGQYSRLLPPLGARLYFPFPHDEVIWKLILSGGVIPGVGGAGGGLLPGMGAGGSSASGGANVINIASGSMTATSGTSSAGGAVGTLAGATSSAASIVERLQAAVAAAAAAATAVSSGSGAAATVNTSKKGGVSRGNKAGGGAVGGLGGAGMGKPTDIASLTAELGQIGGGGASSSSSSNNTMNIGGASSSGSTPTGVGNVDLSSLLPGGANAGSGGGTSASTTTSASGNNNGNSTMAALIELWTSSLVARRDTLSPSFCVPHTQLHQQAILFAHEALKTLSRASEQAAARANHAFQSVEERESQWNTTWQRTTARLVSSHQHPPGRCGVWGGGDGGTAASMTATGGGGMVVAGAGAGQMPFSHPGGQEEEAIGGGGAGGGGIMGMTSGKNMNPMMPAAGVHAGG